MSMSMTGGIARRDGINVLFDLNENRHTDRSAEHSVLLLARNVTDADHDEQRTCSYDYACLILP